MKREIKEKFKGPFGLKLSDLLHRDKMNQKDIAAALGVEQSTISSWTSGNNCPSTRRFIAVCDYFKVNFEYFDPPIELLQECKMLLASEEVAAHDKQVNLWSNSKNDENIQKEDKLDSSVAYLDDVERLAIAVVDNYVLDESEKRFLKNIMKALKNREKIPLMNIIQTIAHHHY